ncbi:fungal-specific transcription factor domain-containing protein [Aspergillus carlsbadensis]|nr:fungal-specific transcription factor domain-containing protein [Aspergillus carlsbadensis]
MSLKLNRSCDQCRHRKIRCIIPDADPGLPRANCTYCSKRGQNCTFSVFRRKARVRVDPLDLHSPQSASQGGLGDLFIDRLLQDGPQDVTPSDDSSIFTTPDEHVASSGLAFFSEQKVLSLTQRIGNSRLQGVVQKLDDFILHRLGLPPLSSLARIQFRNPIQNVAVTLEEAKASIDAFFTNLHPIYPFLDRAEFEAQALSTTLLGHLDRHPTFSALYYAVLALGSQFHSNGTFEPGKGRSWALFQVALSHMTDIILPRESIESVQALTAMSIYAMNTCALQLDDYLISHAARMAITLRYHKNTDLEAKHLRVFWVIYALEKQQTMHGRACSIIPDEDISCAVPAFPEAQYGTFNWFMAYIRIGRISSIVCSSLFSTSAQLSSPDRRRSSIDHIWGMLDGWRQTIPPAFRPGDSAQFPSGSPWVVRLAALQLHYSYYHVVIALDRLSLYLNREDGDKARESKARLMRTARTIIELTRFIEIQPHVPIFILAVLPVSAVFILFDLVIHNPRHPESQANLILLETAAGYFSVVDLASSNALPGSLMAEFSHIARQYYWNAQQPQGSTSASSVGNAGMGVPIPDNPDPNLASFPMPPPATGSTPPQDLEYPVPIDFESISDLQTVDSLDLRTMFGWAFSEYDIGYELNQPVADLGYAGQ